MSFAFFAALGGLVVTLSTVAVLNSRPATRQSVKIKAQSDRQFGQK